MTDQEAIDRLNEMQEGDDQKVKHAAADDVLLAVLRSHGISKVADAYDDAEDRVDFWTSNGSEKPESRERTVPLTDEQFGVLWETFRWHKALTDVLITMVNQVAEEKVQRQRQAWETVDRLTGRQAGEVTTIDWVNRCVVVTPHKYRDECKKNRSHENDPA